MLLEVVLMVMTLVWYLWDVVSACCCVTLTTSNTSFPCDFVKVSIVFCSSLNLYVIISRYLWKCFVLSVHVSYIHGFN